MKFLPAKLPGKVLITSCLVDIEKIFHGSNSMALAFHGFSRPGRLT